MTAASSIRSKCSVRRLAYGWPVQIERRLSCRLAQVGAKHLHTLTNFVPVLQNIQSKRVCLNQYNLPSPDLASLSPAGIGDKPDQVNSLDSDAFLDNENRVTSDHAYYRIKRSWQVHSGCSIPGASAHVLGAPVVATAISLSPQTLASDRRARGSGV